MTRVELHRLAGTDAELAEVQRVLEAAPRYARLVEPEDARQLFAGLPPGKRADEKRVVGIHAADAPGTPLIGVIDVVRGYPTPEKAFLGLLLLSEPWQGKGYGREAYEALVDRLAGWWPETRVVRLAVVATNPDAAAFWAAVGFRATGEVKPYGSGAHATTVALYEASLTAGSRSS